MDQERNEVFERIPWETLERPRKDHGWLVMAVAGAVAVGALAYSFTRSQPTEPAEQTILTAPVGTEAAVSPTTISSPMVVTEADLYAVDSERMLDMASAHAEWFAVEYFSFDGSEASRQSLTALMPEGVPVPEAPEGTQVFVDWVGAISVAELSPLMYRVELMVRSLVSGPDGGFARQPTSRLTVDVVVGEDGVARVSRPPTVDTAAPPSRHPLELAQLPEDLKQQIESTHGTVVGGEPLADGGWNVVVLTAGADGVTRPRTIQIP